MIAIFHIAICRKPLSENTVSENVVKHGVGGLNIDGCRVGVIGGETHKGGVLGKHSGIYGVAKGCDTDLTPHGRFPANLITDGSKEVIGEFPDRKTTWVSPTHANNRGGEFLGELNHPGQQGFNDNGSAARFFKKIIT